MSTPRHAFTLIELLVVIAIIAVLAALLFPVFSQAKPQSQQSVCSSNLKQIAIAAVLYEQDADDRYPLGHTPASDPLGTFDGGGDYEPHFIELLRPYIRNKRAEGVWRCPVDASLLYNTEGNGQKEFHTSYSVNGWFEYGQSATAVEQPASKVYVLESTDDDHCHWWELGRQTASDPYLRLDQLPAKGLKDQFTSRHHEGANYLFADTHVKWAKLTALWGTTRDTNAFWP